MLDKEPRYRNVLRCRTSGAVMCMASVPYTVLKILHLESLLIGLDAFDSFLYRYLF